MAADDPGQVDPTQAFQSRLTKMNGDAMAFATQLFDENFQLREAKRQLGEQLTTLQGKLPAEGAVILTGDDAKAYEAYKALGTPKELKDRIDAYPALEDENKGLKLRDTLREVADVGIGGSKLKFKILEDRVKAAGGNLQFIVKEEGRDKRKVAYVKDGDKETPLEQYAEKNWADYMPSLKAEQAKRTGSANGGEGNGQPAKFDMNTMIRQQAGYNS
jgi:hypothetical protein